jgi:hypothetical protein
MVSSQSDRMFDVQLVSGTKLAVTATVDQTVLLVIDEHQEHMKVNIQSEGGFGRAKMPITECSYYHVHEPEDADQEPRLNCGSGMTVLINPKVPRKCILPYCSQAPLCVRYPSPSNQCNPQLGLRYIKSVPVLKFKIRRLKPI